MATKKKTPEKKAQPEAPPKYPPRKKAFVRYVGPPRKLRIGLTEMVRTQKVALRDENGALILPIVTEEVVLEKPFQKMTAKLAEPDEVFELWAHECENLKKRYPAFFVDASGPDAEGA